MSSQPCTADDERRGALGFPRAVGRSALRAVAVVWQTARAHPRVTCLALPLMILAGAGAGFYWYALHEWHLAREAVKEGRLAEAQGPIDFCLRVWPRSVPVHRLAARAARTNGKLDVAEAHLNRCLKLEKGADADTQLEFLLMRVQTGEVDTVAPQLMLYVEDKHEDTPLILETLARAYMHNLRYGPALAVLDRWVEESPNQAKAHHWRGWVLERLNDNSQAISEYERALELDPDLVAVRLRVAETLLERSNPPEALPHLERLSKQCPDRADVRARLGQCLFMQGRGDEARELLEDAVTKLPDDQQLLITLAKLDMQEDRAARAETWLNRLLKNDPYDLEGEFTLSECLRLLGRQKEAQETLERYQKHKVLLKRADDLMKAEAAHPSHDPQPSFEVGSTLLRVGHTRLGLYWLEQALARDPGHKPTHEALAEYYEGIKDREQAAKHRRFLTGSKEKSNPP